MSLMVAGDNVLQDPDVQFSVSNQKLYIREKALERMSESEQLTVRETVATLQKQVDQLQWKVFGTNQTHRKEEKEKIEPPPN